MNHLGSVLLETERLILRRLSIIDASQMYNNWASDPEVTKFLTWSAHTSQEVTEEYLKSITKSYDEESFYHWGICVKEENTLIGTISVVGLNEDRKQATLGYCIGKTWWHQGYTSEALQEVLRFLLTEVGVNRIAAGHDLNNPYSGAVMAKCKMKKEGVLRQAGMNQQGLCDMVIYGILREDLKTF